MRTRYFVVEGLFKATAVEGAGKLVMTNQQAGLVEILFQFIDAFVGCFDALFGGAQIVARTLSVDLDDAGLADDFGKYVFELVDVFSLADFFGTVFNFVVVIRRRVGKFGQVVDECVQLHGGYGYMNDYPIARLYADTRVGRIYGGSNEVMKELIARQMDSAKR